VSAGLRRFAVPPRGDSAAAAAPGCELCAESLPAEHGHLVDLSARTLACACRACYLLFTGDGVVGRYRAVPRRRRYAPRLPVTDALWDRLAVPVGLAFFFQNSTLEQLVALYPSPAGATESLLALEAWAEVKAAAPRLTELTPDVEALLVHRIGEEQPARFEGFAVPIDACYRLVGLVRAHWRGFDGGAQAWQAIEGLLRELRESSEPVAVAGRG
jgi:hypothetical protein